MTAACAVEIGPNVAAIVGPAVAAFVLWWTQRHTKTTVISVAKTLDKELASNDGSTLRDATDRIESKLGTTPLLPVARRTFDASVHPVEQGTAEAHKSDD